MRTKVLLGAVLVAVLCGLVAKSLVSSKKREVEPSKPAAKRVVQKASLPSAPQAEVVNTNSFIENSKLFGGKPAFHRRTKGETNGPSTAAELVLTPELRDAATMRDLLDSGNKLEALRMARRLLKSSDPDVRMRVITVLGWIGLEALPELTALLADSDEQVAEYAMNQWKLAYETISDEQTKGELLVGAVNAMTSDIDMESMVMSFAQLSRDVAVNGLVQIIQGENSLAGEVAREQYEFLTQTPYTTPQAAAQYLKETAEKEDEVIAHPVTIKTKFKQPAKDIK